MNRKSKDQTIEGTIYPDQLHEVLWFPDIALQDQDELNDENYLQEDRQFGIQMHLLLSRNSENSTDNIAKTLSDLIDEGLIDTNKRDDFLEKALEIVSNEAYHQLHDGKHESWNERCILLPTGEEIIPDRIIFKDKETIILDYKTGSIRKKSYEKQVLRYKQALSAMDFPNVKAYLYYTDDLELVAV